MKSRKGERPLWKEFQRHFKLTHTELRVTAAISSGAAPKAVAQETDTSIWTVRTHLRNIFAKTGTSGQRELLQLLSSFGLLR